MSGRLVVYGASDDLLEFNGDIYDEVDVVWVGPGRPVRVVCGDGTVLSLGLGPTDAVWTVRHVEGPSTVNIDAARGEGLLADADGCPGYSEKATILTDTPITDVAVYDGDRVVWTRADGYPDE